MPTDLPVVTFLRKSATNGFTLLETMLSLAVLGILLVLAVPDFYPMLQRQRFENSASEIRALLEETQSLALTSQVSHRVGFDANDHSLLIKRKHSGSYAILQKRPVEEEMTLEATAGLVSARLALPSPATYSLILLNFRPTSLAAVLGESDKQIF